MKTKAKQQFFVSRIRSDKAAVLCKETIYLRSCERGQ